MLNNDEAVPVALRMKLSKTRHVHSTKTSPSISRFQTSLPDFRFATSIVFPSRIDLPLHFTSNADAATAVQGTSDSV